MLVADVFMMNKDIHEINATAFHIFSLELQTTVATLPYFYLFNIKSYTKYT